MALLSTLDSFFTDRAPLAPGQSVLVALSAGPDSTALLFGLTRLAAGRGWRIHAGHLDHGLDRDSRRRAEAAARICERLAVPLTAVRRPVQRHRGESPEAASRRVRYGFLEELRRELGARYLATAHHRDDQVETVLLRLALGSGITGLAGIPERRGPIVRPLLCLARTQILAGISGSGLEPATDPSNEDLGLPRNRLRRQILPHLKERDPDLARRALGLAAAARRAGPKIEGAAAAAVDARGEPSGASLELARLAALPRPLWPFALGRLHRLAGIAYPPGRRAIRDLERQLAAGSRAGVDCGGIWRWRSRGARLELCRRRPDPPAFAYTLQVPGEIELPEVGLRFRMSREAVAPWMFTGSRHRAALAAKLRPGEQVTIRNRRPGDRIRPLGCAYLRRLKDVLIDRRVPREERDRIPLLCLGDLIAWVPGVTIDDSLRVTSGEPVWVAEVTPT